MRTSAPLDPEGIPSWIESMFPSTEPVIVGAGSDDCGVIATTSEYLIVTTDFVNARPILIELGIGGLEELGRIVVASNLSDLCGSGARPIGLLVGVMAESDATIGDFETLMRGVRAEAERWSVPVLGGDTKLGGERAIYGVAIGSVSDPEQLFLKSRAAYGEDVWISGNVGDCAAGTMAVVEEYAVDETVRQWAWAAITQPQLPLEMSRQLADLAIVKAGTDISDGLAADLLSLCRASNVSVEIEATQIPVSSATRQVAERQELPPWAFGFVLGGDFQFVITAPVSARSDIEDLGFVRIGRITVADNSVIIVDNRKLLLPDLGHRDDRRRSFPEELRLLLQAVRELANG